MGTNGDVEQIRRARRRLGRIKDRLLRPTSDALASSAADLARAAECLRNIDLTANSPIWFGITRRQIEPEVLALRSAIRAINELLQSGANFYGGLIRLLEPEQAPSNYTPSGASAAMPIAAQNSVLLHG